FLIRNIDFVNLKPYFNKDEPYLLEETLISKNPFELFDAWFKNAAAGENLTFEEVNARFLLSNSSLCFMGFCFYTHYNSAKGMEIDANPCACMLFYWPHVNRQIRIEGKIQKLPIEAADVYWYRRPLKSRIGSKLSEQSKVIPGRQYLEERKKELERLATEKGEASITRPEDWGGYRLCPNYFEFWQGQSDRIHDRIVFDKNNSEDSWLIKRLSP
ncbi:unnamed protein product, partial [Thelazia callipaeda]|uniref:pyridoxal 5'-phosphate synthase n=1 Tax=Thelazia callipaeda TaxID=103827 RepID=A0A0N5D9J8_THECL